MEDRIKKLESELAALRSALELKEARMCAVEDVAVTRGRQLRQLMAEVDSTGYPAGSELERLISEIDPRRVLRRGDCA